MTKKIAPKGGRIDKKPGQADVKNNDTSPKKESQSPTPIVELGNAPMGIFRPLTLLAGKAYAATWVYKKATYHDRVEEDYKLIILRNDGGAYGPKNMADLGVSIKLPEMPLPNQRLSFEGAESFLEGYRPDSAHVFNRVIEVVDRFIDFDKSLADQHTMSEMIACWILATWFLDAFNVIGYLWPNGSKGSGKTKLLTIVAELSYLGEVLAGGSFASLRDLADYGATLAFDDTENLSDPKKTDPNKRTLLLAGNRKGSTVSLKEQGPDKKWRTRHVNTYCARLFSATSLPDEILASRTIIVPLIRTLDRRRANADPLEYDLWPCDRRKLIDDLWLLALAHLPELPEYEKRVNREATLTGRNLEPWRALLAIALWLDEKGVTGLWERMEKLSQDYQQERPEFEADDLTVLTVKALVKLAVTNVTNVTNGKMTSKGWIFAAEEIASTARMIANSETDIEDPDKITAQRLGHILSKMRLTKPPRGRGETKRVRLVTLDDLLRWTQVSGLSLPDELEKIRNPHPKIGNIGHIGNIGNSKKRHPKHRRPKRVATQN